MTPKRYLGRRFLGSVLAAAVMAGAMATAVQADAPPQRAEAAIREVRLSDGERRYAVQVTAGGTTFDAGLDSGSTGLCIMSSILKPDDTGAPHGSVSYTYGSGTEISGPTATARLTVGGLSGPSPVMLIRKVDCDGDEPHCPVEKLDTAHFGIQGDGLPDEGFKAILGVAMGGGRVPNPFIRMGVKSWIIELPRPGDTAPGKLILNPTADDTAGFTLFHLFRQLSDRDSVMHDAIEACLVDRSTHKHICGVATLDTGANVIQILAAEPDKAWPKGTQAQILFAQDDKTLQAMDFTVGQTQPSSLQMVQDDHMAVTRLHLGSLPYFSFDVFYDPEHDVIGLRPR